MTNSQRERLDPAGPSLDPVPRRPEDSLLPHLGAACRSARERAGLRRLDLAYWTRRSETTIKRFEDGESWPRDPDAVLAVYAEQAGVRAFELWARAVADWRTVLETSPPPTPPGGSTAGG